MRLIANRYEQVQHRCSTGGRHLELLSLMATQSP